MSNAKPVRTPLPPGLHLEKNPEQATAKDIAWYQSVIGSILYAMLGTRPDMAYATIRLSHYNSNPSQAHIAAAKHLLRYIVGTQNYVLCYDGFKGDCVVGYTDSDYGESKDDRHSTTGNLCIMAGAAISWGSKKQKTVALSATEAEYMALTDLAKQCYWHRQFAGELGQDISYSTPMLADNQGSIFLATNPAHDRRTKHIDIRYHYIREFVENGYGDIFWCPTEDQVADAFTKSLPYPTHVKFVEAMGISSADV